jgi:hypothetical protein
MPESTSSPVPEQVQQFAKDWQKQKEIIAFNQKLSEHNNFPQSEIGSKNRIVIAMGEKRRPKTDVAGGKLPRKEVTMQPEKPKSLSPDPLSRDTPTPKNSEAYREVIAQQSAALLDNFAKAWKSGSNSGIVQDFASYCAELKQIITPAQSASTEESSSEQPPLRELVRNIQSSYLDGSINLLAIFSTLNPVIANDSEILALHDPNNIRGQFQLAAEKKRREVFLQILDSALGQSTQLIEKNINHQAQVEKAKVEVDAQAETQRLQLHIKAENDFLSGNIDAIQQRGAALSLSEQSLLSTIFPDADGVQSAFYFLGAGAEATAYLKQSKKGGVENGELRVIKIPESKKIDAPAGVEASLEERRVFFAFIENTKNFPGLFVESRPIYDSQEAEGSDRFPVAYDQEYLLSFAELFKGLHFKKAFERENSTELVQGADSNPDVQEIRSYYRNHNQSLDRFFILLEDAYQKGFSLDFDPSSELIQDRNIGLSKDGSFKILDARGGTEQGEFLVKIRRTKALLGIGV